jgi:hypothetical protein
VLSPGGGAHRALSAGGGVLIHADGDVEVVS